MTSLLDLLTRLHQAFRDDYALDLGTEQLLRQAETLSSRRELKNLRSAIKERLAMVDDARAQLAAVVPHVDAQHQVWAFTAIGWVETRSELEKGFEAHGLNNLPHWLEYAWTALAEARIESIDRLIQEVPLPAGSDALLSHVRLAALGLRSRDHAFVERFLRTGRMGIEIGGRTVPSRPTRLALSRLEIRLAAMNSKWSYADAALSELEQSEPEHAHVLAAMLARLRSPLDPQDVNEAAKWDVSEITLEAAAESSARSRNDKGIEERLSDARRAIENLPALEDIRSELDRLVLPVSELWLAVAERALREADHAVAELAVDAAEKQADEGDDIIVASVLEIRASIERSAEVKAQLLVDAGVRWIATSELERARADYEAALTVLRPVGSAEAVAQIELRMYDCVLALAQDNAPGSVEDQVREGLERLLQARERLGSDLGDYSWSLLSEAAARLYLARLMTRDRLQQQWTAFEAVLRALAYNLDSAHRWTEVASAASDLYMYQVALWASEIADQLSEDYARAVRTRVLTNSGQFEEVLARVGQPDGWWDATVIGYCLLRLEKPQEALEAYGTFPIDPTALWAWKTWLETAIIAGDLTLIQSVSADIRRISDASPRELDVLLVNALVQLVSGDASEVLTLADNLLDTAVGSDWVDALSLRATARMLMGDTSGGLSDLKSVATSTRDATLPIEWRTVIRPLIEGLLRMHGLDRPNFNEIEEVMDEVRERTPQDALSDAKAGARQNFPTIVRTASWHCWPPSLRPAKMPPTSLSSQRYLTRSEQSAVTCSNRSSCVLVRSCSPRPRIGEAA